MIDDEQPSEGASPRTYLDVDQVPDIHVGDGPQIDRLTKGRVFAVLGLVGAILALAGGVYAMRSSTRTPDERMSVRQPVKRTKATLGAWANSPRETEPKEPTPDWAKQPITLTATQAAAARQDGPAAVTDPCADVTDANEAVECEKRHGKSALLMGAEQSDRNVAAHRGGPGPASDTGKRDRAVEDGDEDSAYRGAYLPAWPKRAEAKAEAGLEPPQPGLGGLGGLSALAGLQGKQEALERLAKGAESDEDQREGFASKGGIPDEGGTFDIGDCDLSAGTPIHGNVKVATISDLPSGTTVTIEVSQTVYCGADSQHVAIPQGARFVGEVNQRVSYGAERQQLCMRQLNRPASVGHPNGDRTKFACMPVSDIQGAPGMIASVDNHWGQVITGSLLSAILGMGPSALAGNQSGFAPSVAQQGAAQAGQNLNQAGQRVVQRELSRKPTLTTPILEGVTVLFASNLELRPWVTRRAPSMQPRRRITWIRR